LAQRRSAAAPQHHTPHASLGFRAARPWKLDRLGRSLPHLIETVAALERCGIGFRSLTEAIDTTTLSGRLVFHLFAALGQFERAPP
jgi:hypothetical protein